MWTRYKIFSRGSINNICNCKANTLLNYLTWLHDYMITWLHKDYKKLIEPLNFLKNFIQKRQSIIKNMYTWRNKIILYCLTLYVGLLIVYEKDPLYKNELRRFFIQLFFKKTISFEKTIVFEKQKCRR